MASSGLSSVSLRRCRKTWRCRPLLRHHGTPMRKDTCGNSDNRLDDTVLQLNAQLRHIECVDLKGTCLKRSLMNCRIPDLFMPRDVYEKMLGTICDVRYDRTFWIR